jgi:hypothetical protein
MCGEVRDEVCDGCVMEVMGGEMVWCVLKWMWVCDDARGMMHEGCMMMHDDAW